MSEAPTRNAADAGTCRPAGLYRRSVAWSIDAALLAPVALLLSWRWIAPAAGAWVESAGSLSWLTLNFGHSLAAFAPQHLALHDRCSGTRVVAGADAPPRWAPAWLGLLALATAGTTIRLANQAVRVMSAALEQALY